MLAARERDRDSEGGFAWLVQIKRRGRAVVEPPGQRGQGGKRTLEHGRLEIDTRPAHDSRFLPLLGQQAAVVLDPQPDDGSRQARQLDLSQRTALDELIEKVFAIIILPILAGIGEARRRLGIAGVEMPTEVFFRLGRAGPIRPDWTPADPLAIRDVGAANHVQREQRLSLVDALPDTKRNVVATVRIAAAQTDLRTGTKPVKRLVEAARRIDPAELLAHHQADEDIPSFELIAERAVTLNLQDFYRLRSLVRRSNGDSRQPAMLPQNGGEIGQRPHANRTIVRRRNEQPAIGGEGQRPQTLRVSGKLAQPLAGFRIVKGQSWLSVLVSGDCQEGHFYGLVRRQQGVVCNFFVFGNRYSRNLLITIENEEGSFVAGELRLPGAGFRPCGLPICQIVGQTAFAEIEYPIALLSVRLRCFLAALLARIAVEQQAKILAAADERGMA